MCDRENNRLQVFDVQGKPLAQYPGFLRPTGIAIGPDQAIYICELEGRISIINLQGEVLSRWGEHGHAPGTEFFGPHGICVDSRGDLYVGEVLDGRRLQKFVKV